DLRLQECGCRHSGTLSRHIMSCSVILTLVLAAPPPDPPPAISVLTQELYSSNTITRSRAARQLGAFKEQARAAVPHLARTLADADHFVARAAADALGQIGPIAVPALRDALRSVDARVRLRALVALSRCRTKDRATVSAL